jgi:tripartite-type tricarboxylate transporter receptor subunit TctC
MKSNQRRAFLRAGLPLAALIATGATALAPTAWADPAYPKQKAITLVVPYTPGGSIDTMARLVAEQLQTGLGQSIIVENRAGASGLIGAEYVARSASDGYTLLFNASSQVEMPLVMGRATYDAEKDFTAISQVGYVPLLVVTHPGIPAKTLREFVSLVKDGKQKYTWATSGYGTSGHLAEELIKHGMKLDMDIISYKGAAPQLTDVMGGHVSAAVSPMPGVYPHVKSGKLRPLAVTSAERLPQLPDVPTVAESGLPGFELLSWYGLWGPAGMPAPVVQRLAAAVEVAKANTALQARFQELSFVTVPSTPAEFAVVIRKDIEKVKAIVADANIRVAF